MTNKRASESRSIASALRSRWRTKAGAKLAQKVAETLGGGGRASDLAGVLEGLGRTEEVAPAIDLRGIEMPTLTRLAFIDLSGVRFDFAIMKWNFGGVVLRGAVFNGAEGRNVDFGGCDLRGSSFVDAKLPGGVFYRARLQEADMSGIALRGGQLKDAICRNAKFRSADLRTVWAAGADFRGADLREANLVGASLGGVQWDEHTRLGGAHLGLEGTPNELRDFALTQGATVRSEKPEWELGLLDATLRALEPEKNDLGARRMIELLQGLRPELERDHRFLWANALRSKVDDDHWSIFQRAVSKAASNMGALVSQG